jgi:hypothetical protein
VAAPLLDAGLTKGRGSRAFAQRRIIHLGPAGFGVPGLAHSLRDPRQCGGTLAHRTRRKRPARDWASVNFEFAPTVNLGESKSPRRSCRRPLQLEVAQTIAFRLRQVGFTYVTLDLEGYRQGSLNAVLKVI